MVSDIIERKIDNAYVAQALLDIRDVCGSPGYTGMRYSDLQRASSAIRSLEENVSDISRRESLKSIGIDIPVENLVRELLNGKESWEIIRDHDQYRYGNPPLEW
jgi:hypothetical protein